MLHRLEARTTELREAVRLFRVLSATTRIERERLGAAGRASVRSLERTAAT